MWDNIVQAPEKTRPGIEPLPRDQQGKEILSVARGGGIVFVGTVATRVLSYIYSLVLIRSLGAESFGQFTLALAILLFVSPLSTIGLSQGIVRYGAFYGFSHGMTGIHQVTMAAIRLVVPVSFLLMFVFICSASGIADLVFHKDELKTIIRILAFSIPFMSLQSLLLAATRSLKLMRYSTIVWIVQPLIAMFLVIVLIYRGLNVEAAAVAYVVSFICSAVLALYFYLRLIPYKDRRGEHFPIGPMLKFSIPLSMTEWIHFTNERTEIFFLGLLPGSVNISIYKISWSLAGLERMLRLSLEQILAPFSSDLSRRREIKQLEALYKATAKWGFTVALLIFLIYLLFGREIMGFFDPSLVLGAGILVALSFAQLFNEFTGPCNTILSMSGRSDLTFLNTVILFVTSIALDWFLIPTYGLRGAAIAGAATIIFVNILRVVEVWITMRIHPFKWSTYKSVLAGLLSTALVFLLRVYVYSGPFLVDIFYMLVFCIAYFALILILRLDAEDRIVIDTVKAKILAFRTRQAT